MKKAGMIALTLVLTLSLAACGRKNNNATTPMSTQSATETTIIPNIIPTMETNIPDPNVDATMPMYTNDNTTETETTGTTSATTPTR